MKMRLTKLQLHLRKHCTRMRRASPRRWWVELVVGNQGFRVGYTSPAPKVEAEWMRDMLAKALSRVPAIVRSYHK